MNKEKYERFNNIAAIREAYARQIQGESDRGIGNSTRDADTKRSGMFWLNGLEPQSHEFGQAAEIVAGKTAQLRNQDKRLPYDLFIASVEMVGLSPCIELVIMDQNGSLYLRRRGKNENVSQEEQDAWTGKLHFPGTTVFPMKRFEMNLYELLQREVTNESKKKIAQLYRESEIFGLGIHDEPARHTRALSLYIKVVIDDPAALKQGYERVTEDNLDEVVPDHRESVVKILNHRDGPLIFDGR